MFIGEFCRECQTTKDTVRFYVAERLLLPEKRGRNYWYSQQEVADFKEIRALQQLGFSIKAICQIRQLHTTQCGTTLQWQANAQIVAEELTKVEEELKVLQLRREKLKNVQEKLIALLQEK